MENLMTEMNRLLQLCDDLFALIVWLPSNNVKPTEKLDHQIDERFQAITNEDGYTPSDIEDVTLALAAFIDEINRDKWPDIKDWAYRFQRRYFNHTVAGTKFFQRLSEIRKDHSKLAVMVVYYLCLRFGFRGEYVGKSPAEAEVYIDQVRRELINTLEPRIELSPHWKREFNESPSGKDMTDGVDAQKEVGEGLLSVGMGLTLEGEV